MLRLIDMKLGTLSTWTCAPVVQWMNCQILSFGGLEWENL
jgi:hypothetical protein